MKPITYFIQLLSKLPSAKVWLSCVLFFLVFQSVFGQQINPDITNLPQRRNDRNNIPRELLNLQRVRVPPLVGREYNFDEIVTLLDRFELQLGESVPVGSNDSIGIIISQQPAAGRPVMPQTSINLTYGIEIPPEFSLQPDKVTVPRYVGLTLERAESRMPNDRLILGQINEVFSEEQQGVITGQFPDPGMEVDPETPVSFEISKGPPPAERVEVPELRGKSLREAAELLQEADLIVGDLSEEPTAERNRRIIDQSPDAGTIVNTGTPVNITYTVPQQLIVVPDVIGMLRPEAIKILKEAGFSFYFEFTSETGAAKNIVTGQEPRPGSRVPPGSDILLRIADSKSIPPWIFWTVGMVAAALLGGVAGSKIKKGKKKKIPGKKDISVQLKPVWDPGQQTIEKDAYIVSGNNLHLKFLPDLGEQTIKTN